MTAAYNMWVGGLAKWTWKTVAARVWWTGRGTWDREDVVQDCYIVLEILHRKFPCASERSMTRLYKNAVRWQINKAFRDERREEMLMRSFAMHVQTAVDDGAVAEGELSTPPVIVAKLLAVLNCMDGRPVHIPKAARRSRATVNKYLCKKVGIIGDVVDVVTLVERWLGTRVRNATLPVE